MPCLVKRNVWRFSSRDSGSALHKLMFSELIARSAAHLKQWADNAAIWWVVWHTHTVRFIFYFQPTQSLFLDTSTILFQVVFCINKSSCLLYINTMKEIIGLPLLKKNHTVDVNCSQTTAIFLSLTGQTITDQKVKISCACIQMISKEITNKWHCRVLIKVQHDAAVRRHLFSVTLLYMFRVSCTHHQEY